MEVTKGDLFKGTGAVGVAFIGVIEEPDDGSVRVMERYVEDGEQRCHKYVKPLSELRSEVGSIVSDIGKSVSVEKIEETLQVSQ